MQMTKRDIADIALVWILASVLISLLTQMAMLASYLGAKVALSHLVDLAEFLGFEGLLLIVLLLLSYVLLFRRAMVLSFLFPNAQEKEIAIPTGLESLASFAFWVRLFGTFEFLSYGIQLVGRFAMAAAVATDSSDGWQLSSPCVVNAIVLPLTGLIVSAAIIWKADWLAEKLTRLGGSGDKASGQTDESRLA